MKTGWTEKDLESPTGMFQGVWIQGETQTGKYKVIRTNKDQEGPKGWTVLSGTCASPGWPVTWSPDPLAKDLSLHGSIDFARGVARSWFGEAK